MSIGNDLMWYKLRARNIATTTKHIQIATSNLSISRRAHCMTYHGSIVLKAQLDCTVVISLHDLYFNKAVVVL